ncbi:MAG: higA [Sediminibacterium sp.]|nr:higA [Sediminibacterium sp.]
MIVTPAVNRQIQQPVYSKIATHPGDVLKDEIEERGLVKNEVARKLGMQPGHLSDLFKGKRHISAALALKLQDMLDISAETWLNMQNRHDLSVLLAQKKIKAKA